MGGVCSAGWGSEDNFLLGHRMGVALLRISCRNGPAEMHRLCCVCFNAARDTQPLGWVRVCPAGYVDNTQVIMTTTRDCKAVLHRMVVWVVDTGRDGNAGKFN